MQSNCRIMRIRVATSRRYRPMEVLVVESEPGVATVARAQLEAAGHHVLRCHDPGRCPLEHDEIDVVLTVRARATAQPTALEDGVTCALRRRVPVVMAGRTSPDPFTPFPVTVAGLGTIVETCERAATGPQLGHERVALDALEQTLSLAGIPTDTASASVRRSGSGLRIVLHVPGDAPQKVRDVAAVRVVGALREYDQHAPRIEISCESP
jgi:hypothetical protein